MTQTAISGKNNRIHYYIDGVYKDHSIWFFGDVNIGDIIEPFYSKYYKCEYKIIKITLLNNEENYALWRFDVEDVGYPLIPEPEKTFDEQYQSIDPYIRDVYYKMRFGNN